MLIDVRSSTSEYLLVMMNELYNLLSYTCVCELRACATYTESQVMLLPAGAVRNDEIATLRTTARRLVVSSRAG